MLFYNKKDFERMRKEAEEYQRKLEEEAKGHKYKSAAEIEITCLHCQHDHFQKGKALLNTRGLTFFDLEWLNDSATTLFCTKCGYTHWFGKEVEQL